MSQVADDPVDTGGEALPGAWPNLFVAGAAKAGTTALWAALDAHPQIWMATPKEPHYFSSWKPSGQRRIETAEQYLSLFAGGRSLPYRGEASPGYFSQVDSAERIKRRCPDARIIVSLREPVARAHSAYLHRQRRHGGKSSFAEAIATELVEGGWKDIVEPGRYATHVERFFTLFGREHVHVLFFEELIASPEATLSALLRFLDLDESDAERLPLATRNEFLVPSSRLTAVLLGPRVRRLARALVPMNLRERGERLLASPAAKPPIDARARAMLEEIYAPESTALAALLQREAPW